MPAATADRALEPEPGPQPGLGGEPDPEPDSDRDPDPEPTAGAAAPVRPDPPRAAYRLGVPVPADHACAVCRGPCRPGFRRCYCCDAVSAALGSPLSPVVPASVVRVPGHLHAVLRGYKDAAVGEARRRFAGLLGELLSWLLVDHRRCLELVAGGPLEVVVPVPSSVRPGPSPLAAALGGTADLLRRGPGALGHLRASPDAFAVRDVDRSVVAGRRVLVVDDSLTTGATAQSAALALRRAGAVATVVAVAGRMVRPEAGLCQARYWAEAASQPFRPERCCAVPSPLGGAATTGWRGSEGRTGPR